MEGTQETAELKIQLRYILMIIVFRSIQEKDVYKRQSMGGTDLFGWMEKNHFDKMGARFLMEAAKNNAGLVLPGCQPVYNPMFGQWLYKNKKMYEDLKEWLSLIHI